MAKKRNGIGTLDRVLAENEVTSQMLADQEEHDIQAERENANAGNGVGVETLSQANDPGQVIPGNHGGAHACTAKPTRKARDKAVYVLEKQDAGTAGGWVALDGMPMRGTIGDPDADIEAPLSLPPFPDAAAALKWAEENLTPPIEVRCVVVKWRARLEEEVKKRTVAKAVTA